MLIQCEKCQTRYNLDEAKIPGKGAKVTCPTCKNIFVVMKDGSQPGATPAAPPPPQSSAPKSLLDSFFDDGKTVAGMFPGQAGGAPGVPVGSVPMTTPSMPGRGLRSWKVRVASGLVYDFTDPATLKTWIAEKKVTFADGISQDGAEWTIIESLANLDAFFGTGAPAATGFGAPGVPPVTGFGDPPTAAVPPFIPPLSSAGASLGDLFGAPPPSAAPDPFAATNPGADPFGTKPSASNPFGSPFGVAQTNQFGDPFGGAAGAPSPPPASSSPVASLPPPPPPAPGSSNPFAPPPPSPFPGGGDPFGAGGASMNAGAADPFGASPSGPPTIAPPPFAAMGGTPRPAPPPWAASGPAAAPTPPTFGGSAAAAPPPPAPAPAPGFTPAGRAAAIPPPIPPEIPGDARPDRHIGPKLAIGAGALTVVALAVAIFLQKDVIWTALRPPPLPTATATPPPAVATLEGEARTRYLSGRRYLRIDDAAAYEKAEAAFRAALTAAPANPRAAAGVLEALALRRASGGTVEEATLNGALGAASSALKEDSRGVETNRALAQYYASVGKPEQALGYLETALASRPEDAESLFLRSTLRSAAEPAGAKEDLTLAAREPDLTRAHRAMVASLGAGTAERTSAEAALLAIEKTNVKVLEALDAGSYAFDPLEVERLMPGEPAATPVVVATVDAATPTPLAIASVEAPTPGSTPAITATPVPAATQTSVVIATPLATPTTKPTTAPTVAPTATPRTTAAAISTPVRATPTPVVARTVAPATPTPTAASDSQIASAGAEDFFVAGNAYLSAGSLPDAIESFRAAVEASPKKTKYQLALGAALMSAGQRQEAADVLTRVREREPNNPDAHKLLGLLFESTGQTAEACSEFGDYLRLAPGARDAADIRTRRVRNGC